MRLARLHVSRDVLLGLEDFRVFWGKPCCMVTFGAAKVILEYFILFYFHSMSKIADSIKTLSLLDLSRP